MKYYLFTLCSEGPKLQLHFPLAKVNQYNYSIMEHSIIAIRKIIISNSNSMPDFLCVSTYILFDMSTSLLVFRYVKDALYIFSVGYKCQNFIFNVLYNIIYSIFEKL